MNKIILTLFLLFNLGWDQLIAQQIPIDSSYNKPNEYNKIKDKYPEARLASEVVPDDVVAAWDVVYLTLPETPYGKRELHADIFRPKKPGKYPAVIMIHGGAWISGNKSHQWAMAQRLAAKGYVTICLEYQLVLEAIYPAALHNIKAAIRWAKTNAENFDIDGDRVVVSGCSAGGQLAMLAGLTNGVADKEGAQGTFEHNSDVQAVIDIDGTINFLGTYSLSRTRTPDNPHAMWLGGRFFEVPLTWKDSSPIYWADESDPPVMILKSGYPRFTTGRYELVGLFDSWGIYSEVHEFDIEVHPFWLFEPWVDQVVDYMDVFLAKVLNDIE